MKIIFDDSRELEIGYINENIIQNRINGGKDYEITSTFTPPDLSSFHDNPLFNSMIIKTSEGMIIDVTGTYNKIENLTISISNKIYSVSFVLVYSD